MHGRTKITGVIVDRDFADHSADFRLLTTDRRPNYSLVVGACHSEPAIKEHAESFTYHRDIGLRSQNLYKSTSCARDVNASDAFLMRTR